MNHIPAWLIPILITMATGTGLSILGKVMPVEKACALMAGLGDKCAILLEALLLRFFPVKAEKEVEEGVFCTLAMAVQAFCSAFIKKLKENNVDTEEKK